MRCSARSRFFASSLGQRIGHGPHLAGLEAIAVIIAPEPQAVEDRGDAGAGNLRVIGLDRRHLPPAQAGTGRIMAFQMVGVQFHQAGDQVIPAKILTARGRTRWISTIRPSRTRSDPSTIWSSRTIRALV